jgi:RNA polymerase sigma factor (sigma-70 family)
MIRLSTWWSAARSERPTAERTSRIQAIAKAHLDAIWRTARDLGVDARDVEDVLQEVLLVVVRRIDDILVDRERAFVLAATARVVANWRRTRRRRPLELSDELDALGPVVGGSSGLPPGPERALEHSERLELLRVALAAMTEAQRVAFTLFELEQTHRARDRRTARCAGGGLSSRASAAPGRCSTTVANAPASRVAGADRGGRVNPSQRSSALSTSSDATVPGSAFRSQCASARSSAWRASCKRGRAGALCVEARRSRQCCCSRRGQAGVAARAGAARRRSRRARCRTGAGALRHGSNRCQRRRGAASAAERGVPDFEPTTVAVARGADRAWLGAVNPVANGDFAAGDRLWSVRLCRTFTALAAARAAARRRSRVQPTGFAMACSA